MARVAIERYGVNKNGKKDQMDIKRRPTKKDVRDMPIQKPSDPLPQIYDTTRHSGFTTMGRPDVRNKTGAVGEKLPARLPRDN